MREKKKASKNLISVFNGRFVSLTLKMNVRRTENRDGNYIEFNQPITIEGYMVRQDKSNIYLSTYKDEEITMSVSRSHCALIEVIEQKDKYDKALDDFTDDTILN